MKNDITKLNEYEIADLLRLKKIDPVYLLESFFNNYKSSTKEKRYAISKELKTDALKEAKRSWVRQKKNTRLSLFDGIPTGWKDIINIKGYQTLAGSRALEKINNKIQSTDAEIVRNSKKKGLVSLFKTSTSPSVNNEIVLGLIILKSSFLSLKFLLYEGLSDSFSWP